MGDISFEEPKVQNSIYYAQPQEKGLIGWLIKNKLAKDKTQATLILLGVLVVVIVITVVVWRMGTGSSRPTSQPPNIIPTATPATQG